MTLRFFYSAPPRREKRGKSCVRVFAFIAPPLRYIHSKLWTSIICGRGNLDPFPSSLLFFRLLVLFRGFFHSLLILKIISCILARPINAKKMVYLSSRPARPKRRLISAISSWDGHRQAARERAIPQKLWWLIRAITRFFSFLLP